MPVRQETQQHSTLETTMAHTKLLESILEGDFISANELFEERMVELQERKMYEAKRSIAAKMYEAKRKYGHYMSKDDWAKWRKSHPSLGAYDTPTTKGKKPESGVEQRKRLGFVKASDVYQDPRSRRSISEEGLATLPKEKEAEYRARAAEARRRCRGPAGAGDAQFLCRKGRHR